MFVIDLKSSVPLVEQIEQQIRQALAADELRAGEPLPPVRQLAGDLGVNLNTVARAYRALEAQGLVVAQRGRGTVVATRREPKPDKANGRALVAAMDRVLSDARLRGFGEQAIRQAFEKSVQRFWQRG